MKRTFTFPECWNMGWVAFNKYPWVVIGASALSFLIAMLGYIPYIGIIFSLVVEPVLIGGWAILMLNVIFDRRPTVGDLFKGFDNFGRFLGTYWSLMLKILAMYVGLLLVAGIPGVPGMLLMEDPQSGLAVLGGLLIAIACILAVAALIVFFYYAIGWSFVFFIVADGWFEGPLEDAFRRSLKITEGRRLWLFGVGLLMGLFVYVGLLGLIVGVFVTSAAAGTIYAAIYKQLKLSYLLDQASGDYQPATLQQIPSETRSETPII